MEQGAASPDIPPRKKHKVGENGGELEIDDIIDECVIVRKKHPASQTVQLSQDTVLWLADKARAIFLEQPMLLEVDAPMKVVGDVHGQFFDLLRLLEYGGSPEEMNYLFLGDYVDRGKNSIETVALLFAYKAKYHENFFLLRGNHECASINRVYGFFDECKRRYSPKLWKTFGDTFNYLPVSALIQDRILCMHGGLSPELTSLDQIRSLQRPVDVPECGLLCDLLWSDPDAQASAWSENDRGVSFTFGVEIVRGFLKKHNLELIARAHQVVEDGYEFFAGRQLVTVFSAPNYCREFDNAGALMIIDENLMCSFKVLKPMMGGAGKAVPPVGS